MLVSYDAATARLRDDEAAGSFPVSESDSVRRSINMEGEFSSKRSTRTQKGMQTRCQVSPEEQSQQRNPESSFESNKPVDNTTSKTAKRGNKTTTPTLDKHADKRGGRKSLLDSLGLSLSASESDDETPIYIPKAPEGLISNGVKPRDKSCEPIDFINTTGAPLNKKRNYEG